MAAGEFLLTEVEDRRLKTLEDLGILDTHPEHTYDQITQLAAKLCETPICLISFVDKERQWFKSSVGIDVSETPIKCAICAHAILQSDLFVVENASTDERFKDNPLVTGALGLRFYAGAPLKVDGCQVGTLCVLDTKPRQITEHQATTLLSLARQLEIQLELRRETYLRLRTAA